MSICQMRVAEGPRGKGVWNAIKKGGVDVIRWVVTETAVGSELSPVWDFSGGAVDRSPPANAGDKIGRAHV